MIRPTPDEMMDYNRYGKIPLGFYETTVDTCKGIIELEPLDNCLEIRAAKELADVLEAARLDILNMGILQTETIICGESGYSTLGACLAFVGAAAAMCKERQAADVLKSISQQAVDEAKAMEGGVN